MQWFCMDKHEEMDPKNDGLEVWKRTFRLQLCCFLVSVLIFAGVYVDAKKHHFIREETLRTDPVILTDTVNWEGYCPSTTGVQIDRLWF